MSPHRPGSYHLVRYKRETNHALHLVLCIVTAGCWLLIYAPLVLWRSLHRVNVRHYHY